MSPQTEQKQDSVHSLAGHHKDTEQMITDSQSSGSKEQDGSICRGASIRSGFLSDLSRQKSIEQKEKVGVQIEESKFSGESSPTLKIAQDPKSLSLPPI